MQKKKQKKTASKISNSTDQFQRYDYEGTSDTDNENTVGRVIKIHAHTRTSVINAR